MNARSPLPPASTGQRPAPVLLALVGLCAGLEAVLTLAGMPPFGLTILRRGAIVYGAFWPGLLGDVMPAFPGQRKTMFVTYAFLHGGLMHMLFNMLMLLHLGREAVQRLGQTGFLLLFMLSAVGGAGVYGLLATDQTPMLGASGAVFGLFGATMFWDFQRRRVLKASQEPVWRLGIGLIVMNVLLFVMVGGMLAWQTHLGGFVAGALVARVVTPSLSYRHRSGRGKSAPLR